MDEVLKASPPESPAVESRRWIGRFLIAVVLGEAIWGFLVSITTNLAQPAMARVLGADPQSPLYLGRGDINVPALFTALLELCFAGIVAVFLNAWTQRPGRTRTQVVRRAPAAISTSTPAPSPTPVPTPAPVPTLASVVTPPVPAPADSPAPAAVATSQATPVPTEVQPAPQEKRSPQSVPATTPKKPKKVYYNIVGEAIESDDE